MTLEAVSHSALAYPTDHAPASLTSDCFEERRDAIDLVATLRARTVRIALFGVMIDRPPSDASVADMDRDALLGALRHLLDTRSEERRV